MIELAFVRHGEAARSWGEHTDPGLSELGKQQAEHAAYTLTGIVPSELVLISSPKLRAQETAAPLADLRSAPVMIDANFQEVPSVTDLANRQEWLKSLMRSRWSEVQEPVVNTWRDNIIEGVHRLGHHSVIFTHFMVLNVIIGHIREDDRVLQFWPDNASITRCRLNNGVLELVELGAELDTHVN